MIKLYSVQRAYDRNDNVYYQILPYGIIGTIRYYFKFNKGLFTLILFLKTCRLTERAANKLKKKMEEKI